MYTTSISLLERLRGPTPSPEAWSNFVTLYTPLLYRWANQLGVPPNDAGDLIQEVFLLLLRKMPEFQYSNGPSRSFRGWLRTVLVNKWREMNRRKSLPMDRSAVASDEAVASDAVEEFSEQEYRQELMRQALMLMQQEFQRQTWQACWEHVVNGRPADQVAAELGMTAGAVRVASSRVLARLRELLGGLVD